MEKPELRPGDEFAAISPTTLGRLINIFQKAKSVDDDAEYTHTGIITDSLGTTLESLWTVSQRNVWKAFAGKRILIVRNVNMSAPMYAAGFEKIRKHIGQWYPVHRLVLHALGLAKWIHWDRVVCSELTAKFETGCAEFLGPDRSAGFMRNHYGVNVDDLVDRWRISRYFTVVFEGRI